MQTNELLSGAEALAAGRADFDEFPSWLIRPLADDDEHYSELREMYALGWMRCYLFWLKGERNGQ